jgi:hypothetical protein
MRANKHWIIGLWLGLAVAACGPARGANCRTDAECKNDITPGRCVDSKCVDCRGDDDCRSPLVCSREHVCIKL